MTDAKTIAASIDAEKSAAAHNLRAILLRLADGEDWRESSLTRDLGACVDLRACEAAGSNDFLLPGDCVGGFVLTSLGREVAELLRPEPWRTTALGEWLVEPQGNGLVASFKGDGDLGERVATLLTADDLAQAKAYK